MCASSSGFLDDAGDYALLGSFTSPGVVVRVELGTTGREPRPRGRLVLNAGEDAPYVALRDGVHGYFGTYTPNGTSLVRVHLPSLTRVSATHLPKVSRLSAGAMELSDTSGGSGGYALLGTRSKPAELHRVWLRGQPPPGHAATPPVQSLVLPSSYGEVRSLIALPGIVAAATSAPTGRLALASLPELQPIQRVVRLADGVVARLGVAASEREVLLASVTNGRSSLSTVAIEPNCAQGGCVCSLGGEATCTRASAEVTLSPARASLRLGSAAGVVSALASDILGGRVYAGTWGGDGEPSQLLALDPIGMRPLGAALPLRAGFEGVLPEERGVRALHVLPHARLLIAACAGAPSVPSAGAAVQFRINTDGSLTRTAALAAPDIIHPVALSILAPTSAHHPVEHIYLVLASMPPVLTMVDALTLKVVHKWELKAAERQFGAGLALPNGDLLLATLGERQVESTTAASAVVRLRVSTDGKLRRMGEMVIPNGDVSCAMLDPSQPDVAYFATASSPAALVKVDTAKWSDASLLATHPLDISDGPVISCALDEKRHVAYLALGGSNGRVVAVSIADGKMERLPGSLRAPGHLVAATSTPSGKGAPLFATSRRSAAALPEAFFRADASGQFRLRCASLPHT